jgi:hypothetical protein
LNLPPTKSLHICLASLSTFTFFKGKSFYPQNSLAALSWRRHKLCDPHFQLFIRPALNVEHHSHTGQLVPIVACGFPITALLPGASRAALAATIISTGECGSASFLQME